MNTPPTPSETFSGLIVATTPSTESAAPPPPSLRVWGVLALLILGGLALIARRRSSPAFPGGAPTDPRTAAPADSGHPGLSHDELLVLLTAAAIEVIGKPVSIVRFRPLTPMDWTWAVQGRVDIHTSHHIRKTRSSS